MLMEEKNAIMMEKDDNVATVLSAVEKDDEVKIIQDKDHFTILAKESIPFGHKIALRKIAKGENIIKYGEVIGRAKNEIEKGAYVHVHNVQSIASK